MTVKTIQNKLSELKAELGNHMMYFPNLIEKGIATGKKFEVIHLGAAGFPSIQGANCTIYNLDPKYEKLLKDICKEMNKLSSKNDSLGTWYGKDGYVRINRVYKKDGVEFAEVESRSTSDFGVTKENTWSAPLSKIKDWLEYSGMVKSSRKIQSGYFVEDEEEPRVIVILQEVLKQIANLLPNEWRHQFTNVYDNPTVLTVWPWHYDKDFNKVTDEVRFEFYNDGTIKSFENGEPTGEDIYFDNQGWQQFRRGVDFVMEKLYPKPIYQSRRIQSMKTPKNIYLNEDTQKLIQRLEKRVGHELKLKFEEGNTPYVEIEKLPKGGYSFITTKYLDNLAEHFLYDGYKEKQDSFIVYLDPAIMYTRPSVYSAYTREDYDRFDEMGNFIPYQPTPEELAKKDEIKKVLEQELSDAYEPDLMDDYVGYDSTNERVDSAVERVAEQFGVDTDFVSDIAREIDYEGNARQMAEADWVYAHCNNVDKYWDWYNGEDVSLEELGIDEEQMNREVDEIVRDAVEKTFRPVKSSAIKSSKGSEKITANTKEEFYDKIEALGYEIIDDDGKWLTLEKFPDVYDAEYTRYFKGDYELMLYNINKTGSKIDSSKAIKSSVEPWDVSQVIGTSDEDLGLSAVVEEYGNEFVNVNTAILEQIKDKLVQYFDDEAYVRDWNINYPNDQIEDAFDITDPEEMDVDDLAQYFDYEAYGRDIRLNDRMAWDTEDEHWVSLSEVEDENNDRYITW